MNLIKSSSFDYYKTRMEQAIKEIHRLSLLFESNRSQPVGDKHLWMQWLIRHIATHLYGMLTTHTHRIRTCTWVAKIIIPPLTPYLTRPSESRLRPTWRKDENYFVLFGSLKVPIAPYPKNIARKYQQQSWFGNNTDNRYVDNPKTPFPPPWPPDRNDPHLQKNVLEALEEKENTKMETQARTREGEGKRSEAIWEMHPIIMSIFEFLNAQYIMHSVL